MAWRTQPFVYVYVTRIWTTARSATCWCASATTADTGRHFRVLLSTPPSATGYHNGGRIRFGPDHKLYVMVGDGHNSSNAQDRTNNLQGKILRLDRDGTAAAGNPYGRIWSFGHRNSFGFTFDPQTGRLWETENGPPVQRRDQPHRQRGATTAGSQRRTAAARQPGDTNNSGPTPRHLPKTYFPRPRSASRAMRSASRCGLGASVNGDLVFGDVNTGSIRAII